AQKILRHRLRRRGEVADAGVRLRGILLRLVRPLANEIRRAFLLRFVWRALAVRRVSSLRHQDGKHEQQQTFFHDPASFLIKESEDRDRRPPLPSYNSEYPRYRWQTTLAALR